MKRNIKIKVEHNVLSWAREAMGFNLAEASKQTKLNIDDLKKWESETTEIPLSSIKKLGKLYKRQISFFFLPSAPLEKPVPADFRTLDSAKYDEIPQKVRIAIRRAQANRKTIKDFFSQEYELKLNKKISLTENPTNTGEVFRNFFNVTIEQQILLKDEKDSLAFWIQKIEEKGIPIFQMELEENFRGFCLRENNLPPIIVANVKDARAAKVFTIVHELSHLFINQSEIDNLVQSNGEEKAHIIIEAFANEFAGSFLIPNKYLQNEELFKKFVETKEDALLSKLSKRFSVSESVIARRMYALGVMTKSEYEAKEKELKAKYQQIKLAQKAKLKEKPGSFVPRNVPRETIQKIGYSLGSKAFQAVSEGRMTTFDLIQFLDIKIQHIDGIQTLMRDDYKSLA